MDKSELYRTILEDRHIQEKKFRSEYPEFYAELCNVEFPEGFTFRQKLYHYLNDDTSFALGVCECGNRCKFISLNEGYKAHCSRSCATKSLSVKEKRKKTCLEKYGVEHESKCEAIKEKKRETCKSHYGVEHPMQSDEVRKKSMETNIANIGVSCPFESDAVKQKSRKTCMSKYGVEHHSKAEAVKEKKRNTSIEHYGVDCPLKSDEVKERIRETVKERYGVEYIMQSEEVKARARKTTIERYGTDCVLKLDSTKEKAKRTSVEKYGVEHPMQSDEVKKKVSSTCKKHYGVDYPIQSDTIKERTKQTNLERYGVEYATQSEEFKKKLIETNIEKYGVPYTCMLNGVRRYSNDSKPNKRFAELLSENGIEYEREFSVGKYVYDFKVGDVLVEINPTITHNSFLDIFGGNAKDRKYHFDKTSVASENGYRCIHVWDWDDTAKIVNMLKPKETLYARKLSVAEVNQAEADEFLSKYHIQGTCKGMCVCVGLYLDGVLVEIMTFGKPRYNRKCEWELLRLCTDSGYIVVGGAERLFSRAVAKYDMKSVVSYCDNSKFDGYVYARLGFKKTSFSFGKHWFCKKDKRSHITDNMLRQRGYDQLFGTDYGKGTSNEILMLERGFLPVYDAGQYTFVWTA